MSLKVCALFSQVKECWLWHKTLCHVNFDNLVNIRNNRRVRGILSLKKPKMEMFKQCQIEKMGKTSFKSKNYNTEEVLELVHIDLCGPIGTTCYNGENYFILFVDDHSRMMIVMFLKEKLEAF